MENKVSRKNLNFHLRNRTRICLELLYLYRYKPLLTRFERKELKSNFVFYTLMIERPFPATEKVLAALIETGKYSQISRESYLIVKENYVSRKMNSFVSIFLLASCLLV